MKILIWVLRIVVFVALFGLAIKNSGLVELRFFFDRAGHVPLSLVVLAAFVAGVAIGLTAVLSKMVRMRRELGKLRRIHDADKRF